MITCDLKRFWVWGVIPVAEMSQPQSEQVGRSTLKIKQRYNINNIIVGKSNLMNGLLHFSVPE
jgi:hypothetical protein